MQPSLTKSRTLRTSRAGIISSVPARIRYTFHVSFDQKTMGSINSHFSIRFRPVDTTDDWVLAATVTTDARLDLGVASMSDDRHTAFLIAPRDTVPPRLGAPSDAEEYVILVHPALSPRSPTMRFGTDSLVNLDHSQPTRIIGIRWPQGIQVLRADG